MCSMKRLVKRMKWVAELAPGPTRGFLISSSYCPLPSPSFPLSPPPPPGPVPSPSIPPAIPLPSSPLNHNRMVPFSAQSQFANWKIARLSGIRQSPTWPRFNPNEKPDDGQLQDDPGHFQCLQQDDGHFQCLTKLHPNQPKATFTFASLQLGINYY